MSSFAIYIPLLTEAGGNSLIRSQCSPLFFFRSPAVEFFFPLSNAVLCNAVDTFDLISYRMLIIGLYSGNGDRNESR